MNQDSRQAIADFRQSHETLREAITADLRRDMNDLLQNDTEIGALRMLVNVAAGNRASWSGGAYSDCNVVEAVTREVALHLANELVARIDMAQRKAKTVPA